MLKTFRYKLNPTEKQAELLNKHMGAARFVYNLVLEVKDNAYRTYGVNVGSVDLINQLTYKCEWMGKNLLVIDRFAPSRKMCSACGSTNHSLTLSDREWVCGSCGTLHDRDHNAAVNISNFAYIKYSGVERTVEPVESPTLVGAMKQENHMFTNRLVYEE